MVKRNQAKVQRGSVARARALRRRLTAAEHTLWSILRNRGLGGLKFRRQHPLGLYIVDFYCAEKRLVVELDGDSHAGRATRDAEREAWLEAHGYRVMRFTNREVMQSLPEVLEAIWQACQENPHPNPSPWQGEGQHSGGRGAAASRRTRRAEQPPLPPLGGEGSG